MYGYKVKLTQRTHSSDREAGEFGSWASVSTWHCNGVAEKVQEYPDITSSLDIPVGSNALVVWAQWGSGDSFGHAEGAYAECYGIFTDLDSAVVIQRLLENHREGDTCSITTPDGQMFSFGHLPWHHYFETLELVKISPIVVW